MLLIISFIISLIRNFFMCYVGLKMRYFGALMCFYSYSYLGITLRNLDVQSYQYFESIALNDIELSSVQVLMQNFRYSKINFLIICHRVS